MSRFRVGCHAKDVVRLMVIVLLVALTFPRGSASGADLPLPALREIRAELVRASRQPDQQVRNELLGKLANRLSSDRRVISQSVRDAVPGIVRDRSSLSGERLMHLIHAVRKEIR